MATVKKKLHPNDPTCAFLYNLLRNLANSDLYMYGTPPTRSLRSVPYKGRSITLKLYFFGIKWFVRRFNHIIFINN